MSLPWQDHKIVHSLGVVPKMQLPEHGRLVTRLLKNLRKGNLGGIKGIVIIYFPINMGMFSGKYSGPGGCTDRIGNAGISEQHALLGQTINIWGLDQMITISTNGLIGMIIGHDKQEVGLQWLLLFFLCTAVQTQKTKSSQRE